MVVILMESANFLISDGSIKFYANLLFWIFAALFVAIGVMVVLAIYVQQVKIPLIEAEGEANARPPVRRVARKKKEND